MPDWEGCSQPLSTQLLAELDDIFTQVLGSSARLIPMSQELTDTYSAILQKNLLQASHGEVLIGAISRMIEQAERLRTWIWSRLLSAAKQAEQRHERKPGGYADCDQRRDRGRQPARGSHT